MLNRPVRRLPVDRTCRRSCSTPSPTRTTATAASRISRARPSTTPSDFFDTLLRAGQRGARAWPATSTSTTTLALIEKHFGGIRSGASAEAARLRRAAADRRAARARTTTRTRRSRRSRSATGCPTRSATSTRCSRTCCWPRCSPTATPPGCSAAWCSATAWSPTSRAYIGEFGDPFDERDPTHVHHHRALPRRRRRSTRSSRAIDEELDRHRRRRPRAAASSTGSGPGWSSVLLRELDAVMLAHAGVRQVRADPRPRRADRRAAGAARRGHRRRRPRRGRAALRPDRRAVLELVAGRCPMSAHRRSSRALTAPRRAREARASPSASLDNGLRVVAVRKPGVPIVEVRLRMPFLSAKPAHPARAALLADTHAHRRRRSRPGRARRRDPGARRRPRRSASTPTGCVVGGNVLATNLRGAARTCSPRC